MVTGPFISIPCYENYEETYYENGATKIRVKKVKNYIHILPELLDITGNVETEELSRGLYDIVVYKTPLVLKKANLSSRNISKPPFCPKT